MNPWIIWKWDYRVKCDFAKHPFFGVVPFCHPTSIVWGAYFPIALLSKHVIELLYFPHLTGKKSCLCVVLTYRCLTNKVEHFFFNMIKSQLHLFLWTLIAQSIFTVGYWSLFFFKDLYILDVLTFSHWWINAGGSCSLLGWETPCKKKSGFMVLIFDCWQLLSRPSTSSAPHVALRWIWKWLERARKGGLFGVSLLLGGGAGARVPAPRLNFCQHRRREHSGLLKRSFSDLVSRHLPCGRHPTTLGHRGPTVSLYCVKARPL